jgi:hypothetical protein
MPSKSEIVNTSSNRRFQILEETRLGGGRRKSDFWSLGLSEQAVQVPKFEFRVVTSENSELNCNGSVVG